MDNIQTNVMFWDIFSFMCDMKGVDPTNAMNEMKMSTGSFANWKTGSQPRETTLRTISEYFGVELSLLKYIMTCLNSKDDMLVSNIQDNWQKYLAEYFPGKDLPKHKKYALLTEYELCELKEYIQNIRENLAQIERLINYTNINDRH